jgi:S-formylglutathione hydrolase FrmB
VLAVLSASVYAQQPRPSAAVSVAPVAGRSEIVRTLALKSKLMGREMPYRIILPDGYSAADTKVSYPVIYLLHGLTGHFNNWTDLTRVADYAKPYKLIIVMPEGGDGWYTDSVTVSADKYESYIIQELIPEIDGKFRTLTDRGHRFIAGLSMGGYGAIKFGFKYPQMFSLVGSFSGALGAASFTEANADKIGKSVEVIYGPIDSETRKTNDVFGLLRSFSPAQVAALPYIYQSCGTEDFLFKNNREFVDLLVEKKVPHEYRETPGAHNWTFWDAQVKEFLQLADARLKNPEKIK